jgi:hypothetical protein
MLEEPPEHYRKAVDTSLDIMERVAPGLISLSEEGVVLNTSRGIYIS